MASYPIPGYRQPQRIRVPLVLAALPVSAAAAVTPQLFMTMGVGR